MQETLALLSTLADPTRLQILSLLADNEACVCHLQEILRTHQPKVSRHLAQLRTAGLVHSRRQGKWIFYSLAPKAQSDPILRSVLQEVKKGSLQQKQSKRLRSLVADSELGCC